MQALAFATVAVVGAALFVSALPSAAEETVAPAVGISDPLSALPKLEPAKARVFFFRPERYVGFVVDARVRINGHTVGWVGNGSAIYVDYAPGDVIVGIGGSDGYGHDFGLTLQPGQEYFITLAAQANVVAGVLGVVASMAINSRINQQHCGNGWCAGVVDRTAAMPELSRLSISGANPHAN
jgi:hypothetical protein